MNCLTTTMERLIILACLLGASLAHWQGIDLRDGTDGPADICQSVEQLLDQASKGMEAADLASEAAQIQAAADAYLNSLAGQVPHGEVEALINATAADLNAQSTITALFGDPLTYSGEILEAAFNLLNNLCEGETSDAGITAVSMTLEAVQDHVQDIVEIVTYMEKGPGNGNPEKKQHLSVKRKTARDFYGGGGVLRRALSEKKRGQNRR